MYNSTNILHQSVSLNMHLGGNVSVKPAWHVWRIKDMLTVLIYLNCSYWLRKHVFVIDLA